MDVTDNLRITIDSALKDKGISRKELAESVGQQKPWGTRLFNGGIKRLSDDQVRIIEELLDIELAPRIYIDKEVSPIAAKIDEVIQIKPGIVELVEGVLAVAEWIDPNEFSPEDMQAIGHEVAVFVTGHGQSRATSYIPSDLQIARFIFELLRTHAISSFEDEAAE